MAGLSRRRLIQTAAAGVAVSAVSLESGRPAFASVPAIPSGTIRTLFGVNTHIAWQQTPYANTVASQDAVVALTKEVGASHFRSRYYPGDPEEDREIPLLVAAGCKFYAQVGSFDSTAADVRADIQSLAATVPATSLRAIAGINEPDDAGVNWVPHTLELQQAIYAEVRSIPAFDGVPVASPVMRGTDIAGITAMGDAGMAAYTDMVALHHYPGPEPFTGKSWPQKLAAAQAAFPGQPVSVNEYGYRTPSPAASAMPEWVSATYEVRALCTAAAAGLWSLATYQLLDDANAPTDPGSYFGIVDSTMGDPSKWRRKPSFDSLKLLVALTRDTAGPVFTPAPLAATITGTPNTLVLGKRDGSHGVLHWRDDMVYNNATGQTITLTPAASTVKLGSKRTVTLTNVRTGVVSSLGSVSSYTVNVAGDVIHAGIV